MAVANVNKSGSVWANRRAKTTYYKVREKHHHEINYANLVELLHLQGLQSKEHDTTEDAHHQFMKRYRSIFEKSKLMNEINTSKDKDDLSSNRSNTALSTGTPTSLPPVRRAMTAPEPIDHIISHHTKHLHRQRLIVDEEAQFRQRIKALKKLVKIVPYERSRDERVMIYRYLKHMPKLSSLIPVGILKELASTIQYERWTDVGCTAFATNCLYFIVRGKVRPNLEAQESYFKLSAISSPYPSTASTVTPLRALKRDAVSRNVSIISDSSDGDIMALNTTEKNDRKSPTPTRKVHSSHSRLSLIIGDADDEIDDDYEFESNLTSQVLTVGDIFGTLTKGDLSRYSKILAVTIEEPSDLFRISVDDYERIKTQFEEQDSKKKFELLRGCCLFSNWPKSTLSKLSNLVIWRTFPAGAVLVREDEKISSIAFIRKGQCQVYRQVKVPYMASVTQMATRTKRVPMGHLGNGAYFGNLSVLSDKTEICTIVATTEVEIGLLTKSRINRLDSITIAFLMQSEESTGIELTQEQINDKYVNQQLNREWTQYKQGIIGEVLASQGVYPGAGKWKFHSNATTDKFLWTIDTISSKYTKSKNFENDT